MKRANGASRFSNKHDDQIIFCITDGSRHLFSSGVSPLGAGLFKVLYLLFLMLIWRKK